MENKAGMKLSTNLVKNQVAILAGLPVSREK